MRAYDDDEENRSVNSCCVEAGEAVDETPGRCWVAREAGSVCESRHPIMRLLPNMYSWVIKDWLLVRAKKDRTDHLNVYEVNSVR